MADNTVKVAALTYLNSDNFGSVLQAYALNRTLIKQGYDAYVIDYRKRESEEIYKIFQPNNSRYNILTNVYNLFHYGELKESGERYSRFREKAIVRTARRYRTEEELMSDPPEADCYVCGSDQIWNTGIRDFDRSFFLDFVKDKRKISYAASGINKYTTDESIDLIVDGTKDFSALSVREDLAKRRLEERGAKNVSRVLDPTLLLDAGEWKKFIKERPLKSPYMFCYFAGGVSRAFDAYTAKLARLLGLRRVLVMSEWKNAFRSGKKLYGSGPEDFLSLIYSADMVCTNSFHGTAFSVLFNKPFIVGMHEPFQEDRVSTLLRDCGLEDREIDPETAIPSADVTEISFERANLRLGEERAECIKWLKTAIEGETK